LRFSAHSRNALCVQDPLVGAITLRLVNDDDWKAAVRETARAQPTKPPTHRTADH
jgi:hypothetical protein